MSRPVLFVFILTAIVLFLIGVRVGNKVKEIDSQNNIKNIISPTVINTPKVIQLAYKTYQLPLCKNTFILSNLFEQKLFASNEALFNYQSQKVLVSCKKQTLDSYKKLFSTQSASIKKHPKNTKINIYNTPEGKGYILFKNNINVLYSVHELLLPLFPAD